jgi:hypothetical protein
MDCGSGDLIGVRLSDGWMKSNPGLISMRLSDAHAKQEPGIIAVRLSDGLGNRLFQLAALLGYAERWDMKPVLFPSQIIPSNHADAALAHKLFPRLELVWNMNRWGQLLDDPVYYASYKPFEKPETACPLLLHGYFQTEKYFPSYPIVLSFESVLSSELRSALDFHYPLEGGWLPRASREYGWWVHIRLGDYMILPHHQIDLRAYLRKVLGFVPAGERVLVFSDSPEEAQCLLREVGHVEWMMADPGLSPLETLYVMGRASRGCICTNSTFSWWGAYGSEARRLGAPIYFPGQWSRLPYPAEDVYPSWGIRVDF